MSLQVRRRQGFFLLFIFFFLGVKAPRLQGTWKPKHEYRGTVVSRPEGICTHTFSGSAKAAQNSCSLFVIAGRKQNGKGGCGGMKVQFNTYIQRFLTQARFPLYVINPIRSWIWKLKHRKSSFDNTTWWFQHILQHLRKKIIFPKRKSPFKKKKKETEGNKCQISSSHPPPKNFFWMLRTNYCMTIHVKKSLFFLATPAWEDNSIFHGTRDHRCLSTKGINPHTDVTVYPFPPHPQQCPVFSVSGGDH